MAFRSEADARAWERATAKTPGATVPVEVLGELSRRWYAGRLEDAWRPSPVTAKQARLNEVGLAGPFWDLT